MNNIAQLPASEDDLNILDFNGLIETMEKSSFIFSDSFETWLFLNNPIWLEFVKKAREAKSKGHTQRFSAKTIIEIMRWESPLREQDVTFKISNNHTADLARLVTACWPAEFNGYFRINKRAGE